MLLNRHQRYRDGSVYVGHWEHGARSGYGVYSSTSNREKYLGAWLANERHGEVRAASQETSECEYWTMLP